MENQQNNNMKTKNRKGKTIYPTKISWDKIGLTVRVVVFFVAGALMLGMLSYHSSPEFHLELIFESLFKLQVASLINISFITRDTYCAETYTII